MGQIPTRSPNLDTYPISDVVGAHDPRADLAAIRNNLFDGEAIEQVYRGNGSGIELLAVTNLRIMLVEQTVWKGRIALTSIPYGRLTAVSFMADDDHPIDRAITIEFALRRWLSS